MIPNYCATLAFSPTSIPTVLGGSWMHLVFLGLFASALLMAMVLMAGRLLRIPKLEAWSRHEFFQICATAVLALFIGGWMFGMCSWNVSFLSGDLYGSGPGQGGPGVVNDCGDLQKDASGNLVVPKEPSGAVNAGAVIVTPYCAAQGYLSKVEKRGADIFQSLIGLNAVLSYLFRMTWESRPLGIGYTLEPLAGFQQLQNIFLVGVSGFMVSFLSLIIQERILDFMLVSVPFFFMPLGLLLRGFSPTREFGGALVGFSIASLFFFPLILMLNDLVIYSSLDEVTRQAPALNAALFPNATKVLTIPGAVDLSTYGNGDTLGDASTSAFEITTILDQGQDRLVFDSATSGKRYMARLETSGGAQQTVVYQLNSLFDPSQSGSLINMNSGLYQDQQDSNGDWAPRTDSATNKSISYFTGPDPSAPNEPVSPASKELATAIFWPVEMVMIFSMASILLPIINFLIYIEMARQLTRMFGAEMDLSNLTRMI